MTDTYLLECALLKKGLKKSDIAAKIGLSYYGFLKKVKGENEFRQSEIDKLSKILCLTVNERMKIFFAEKRD